MMADGTVPLIISHAPEAEAQALRRHSDWEYRKIAFNHFIIVGSPNDPAKVRLARDAVTAFRRIAASPAFFVSRGDRSGTHEREQALWKAAAVTRALRIHQRAMTIERNREGMLHIVARHGARTCRRAETTDAS